MNKFMSLALKRALQSIRKKEGGPFGACIVKNNKAIAITHNTVLKSKNATCHAEINAIRLASKKLKTWKLKGCEIYSTTEPCPMCFSAIHWAQIDKVYCGTNIGDVKALGFNELAVTNFQIRKIGKSKVKIKNNFEQPACLALLQEWSKNKTKLY